MTTITELEAAVQVEQNALEAAYRAGNKIGVALYGSSLKRALVALVDARRQEGET
ncbi:hypothetical protein [Microbacterium aerolatum]|uniref:hypothetical protein n=1 Tax=Microbacterium aerolatum TaxID=153731 RepID=UPI00384BCB93